MSDRTNKPSAWVHGVRATCLLGLLVLLGCHPTPYASRHEFVPVRVRVEMEGARPAQVVYEQRKRKDGKTTVQYREVYDLDPDGCFVTPHLLRRTCYDDGTPLYYAAVGDQSSDENWVVHPDNQAIEGQIQLQDSDLLGYQRDRNHLATIVVRLEAKPK